MTVKFIQVKKTTLSYSISDSATTIKLDYLQKLDGTSLTASDLGTALYGTFAPGTSREEIFSIDGTNATFNADGTVEITNTVRGLKEIDPYTTGGYSCDHGPGEIVIFGNNPQVYDAIYDYINGVVVAGGVPATDTIPGLSIEATTAQIDSDTEEETYNSTPYKLFINPAKLVLSKFGLRLPTLDQKDAFAGTQGVPSATNKFVTSDNVYDSETDQTQGTQNGTIELGETNSTSKKNLIAQSFIPAKTKIRGVKLFKIANTGTFTGSVTVSLQADTSGSPSGTDLASVTISNTVYNALANTDFNAVFTTEYSMTVGSLYWIVISTSTSDTANHPNLGTNTSGGYANGSAKYKNTADGWVAISTIDIYFKTLQGVDNQIVQANSSGKISTDLINYKPYFQINSYGTTAFDGVLSSSGTGDNFYPRNGDVVYSIPRNNAGSLPAILYSYTFTTGGSGYIWKTGSVLEIGDYVYIMGTTSQYGGSFPGTLTVVRADKKTLANNTPMTASGHIFSGGNIIPEAQLAYTDGTYIYIYLNGTTWEKWSISGTTLTYVADVTAFTGTVGIGLVSDNTNVYTLTSSAGVYTLNKYRSTGELLIESRVVQASGSLFSGTTKTTVLGITIGATGIVYLIMRVLFSTATTNDTGNAYYFLPIATS